MEIIKISFRFRFQPVDDGFFSNRLETAVAAQAAAPGFDFVVELVAVENGRYLFP